MIRAQTILWSLVFISSVAFGNDIYIQQSGDNLDLDVTQDGQNNVAGTSQTDISLTGDNMTFSINQVGNSNIVSTTIDGNTYTGNIDLTGNSNDVALTCDANSSSNCETVSMSIDVTGDSAVTIAINSGSSLPSGISLGSTSNPSGSTYRAVLSGTLPNAASETTYNFTLKATDAQGQVTTQALSITAEVGINNAGGFC